MAMKLEKTFKKKYGDLLTKELADLKKKEADANAKLEADLKQRGAGKDKFAHLNKCIQQAKDIAKILTEIRKIEDKISFLGVGQ